MDNQKNGDNVLSGAIFYFIGEVVQNRINLEQLLDFRSVFFTVFLIFLLFALFAIFANICTTWLWIDFFERPSFSELPRPGRFGIRWKYPKHVSQALLSNFAAEGGFEKVTRADDF